MKNLISFLSAYFTTLYRRRFLTKKRLNQWQDKQVVKLLRYVLPKSPFYRDSFGGKYLSFWRAFPECNKQKMMENFDTFNTVGIKKSDAFNVALNAEATRKFDSRIGDISVGLSSGTSGNRGLFLVSAKERSAWAGVFLAKILPGSLLQKHSIALFLRANSELYKTLRMGRISFEYFDLFLPMHQHIERLNRVKPDIILAPPSMLRYLAEQLACGRLKIRPKKIISVAETLDPLDEKFIRREFKQTIHQVYQCTEGFLATTCAQGTLHLNEDLVVIQKHYLDWEQRKFSPIVTDINRKTQPIIRYHLNDILTEAKDPCKCGSPFTAIESIEGRCDDMFYLPSCTHSGAINSIFPDYIRRAIIASSEDIEEYMVIQHQSNEITVSLTISSSKQESIKMGVIAALQNLFSSLDCIIPDIKIVNDQTPPLGHKLRRIHRLC